MKLSAVFIVVVFISCTEVKACIQSSYGTEFVFGFVNMKYYKSHTTVDPVLQLRVMTDYSTSLDVSIPSRSSTNNDVTMETHHTVVYGYRELSFNTSFINERNNNSIGGAVKVTTTHPISLVAMYNVGPYVVSPQILPTSVLTNNYIVPSFVPNRLSHSNAEILVIALNDSTNIEIKGYSIDRPIHHTLNALQTYIYQANDDLSSVTVVSNNRVAVFSTYNMGDTSTYHSSYDSHHHPMTIQVPPIDVNAFHFIVPAITMSSDIDNYLIRVYAKDQGAHVQIYTSSVNVKHVHIFNEIFYEMKTRSSSTIEIFSDTPIVVVQLGLFAQNAMFMVPIPAVSQYMTSYLAIDSESIGAEREWQSTYVIVLPEEEASGLLVDKKPLLHNVGQVAHGTPLGNNTVITLTMANHAKISHVGQVKFGLFVYGHNTYTRMYTYAHAAGMKFKLSDCAGGNGLPGNIVG